MNQLAEDLRANKLKVTPQRLTIYSYLKSTNSHPTVETIYNALKADFPTISLATVYKTVASLRDAHLVNEINFGEDSHRYDANMKTHSHLVCTCCHKVYDYLDEIDLKGFVNKIENEQGFEIDSSVVNFYGICPQCKEKN